ncbi:MAG: hypothetical protein WAV32_08525 [Halobacteriota archaeon]
MKNETLLRVFNELSGDVSRYKVMSEGELALKIRASVSSLSEAERAELGGNQEDMIFRSITTREDKISVFSPDMHTKVNYQGEIFYCLPTHRYLSDELEDAFLRWAVIRTPLSVLKRVVVQFMELSGYRLLTQEHTLSFKARKRECECLELIAEKANNKRLHICLLASIKFVPYFISETVSETISGTSESVIIVPTEKTPAPFISFFREQDIGDRMIWVADIAKRTIDPFMGLATDGDIERNFANPGKARSAVSMWMKKVPFFEL